MPLTPERLHRLVRQRQQLESLQEGRLGKALQREGERRRALSDSQTERTRFFSQDGVRGLVEPALLSSGSAYTVRLNREISARTAALANSTTEVEVERDRLLDRRRDRRAMETLLENREAALKLAASRAQAKQLDEQAAIRWLLRRPTTQDSSASFAGGPS